MSELESNKGTGSFISQAIDRRFDIKAYELAPPLPGKISIEINNSCNHSCFFCPNPIMKRARALMRPDLVNKIMRDARDNEISEISFYSTGEPFLNKMLPDYVRTAKELGFDYVYLSSNGGNAVSKRIQPVLDAGLDSLKFSVNAGDRETYALVHGEDEFDEVMHNIERCAAYRDKHNPSLKLFISFVETAQNKSTFELLKKRVGALVDEVILYPFIVIGTPLKRTDVTVAKRRPYLGYEHVDKKIALNQRRTTLPCYQLWTYLNVTLEGYLSACCSDFDADLVVGNLNRQSLIEAWHSEEFRALRQKHIDKRIRGTVCASCIAQKALPYEPINQHLMSAERSGHVLSEADGKPAQ